MSHQRANSTSSISSSSAFDTHHSSNSRPNKYGGGMATDSSTASTASAAPLSISVPRQRSFSTSLSLANSPRTFTGSSIIANPSNGLFSNSPGVVGSTTPFSSAFGPLSPTTASASTPNNSHGGANPSTAPVLHRRFSSSFNQLNQIATPSNSMGSQTNERGRRASFFGGATPQILTSTSSAPSIVETNKTSPTSSGGAGGLFRKFSTTGKSTEHLPSDRNDTGPVGAGSQPNSTQQPLQQHHQQLDQQFAHAHAPLPVHGVAISGNGSGRLSAVNKLKPSQEKHSRSNSPMRSMILNGQMLD